MYHEYSQELSIFVFSQRSSHGRLPVNERCQITVNMPLTQFTKTYPYINGVAIYGKACEGEAVGCVAADTQGCKIIQQTLFQFLQGTCKKQTDKVILNASFLPFIYKMFEPKT